MIAVCQFAYAEDRHLKVYVADMKPLVIIEEAEDRYTPATISGFEIDLWNEIGQELVALGLVKDWEFVTVAWSELEKNIKMGNADVACSGITIRSDRMEWAEFSAPTVNSGLGIMVLKSENKRGFFENIFYRLSVLYNALCGPVAIFGVFILISAHFFWLIAKFKGFNGIDGNYFPGIFDATFYSVVSSSTVGYGDQTPKKTLGRVATIILIFCGGIFYCNFTAILSADYTTEIISGDIQNPEDLKGKIVLTQKGTTSVDYVKQLGASKVSTVSSVPDACDDLLLERGDAVVYDYPVLRNYVKENIDKVEMVGGMFDEQYYGYAFPLGSDLKRAVDVALYKLREDGTYNSLYEKWF